MKKKKKFFETHWVAWIPSQPLGLLPLKKKTAVLTGRAGRRAQELVFLNPYYSKIIITVFH